MLSGTSTFNKLKIWIKINRNVSNTVQNRLSPNFKRFVLTLSKEEQLELMYDKWINRDFELTDSGYKALVRMADLLN